MSVLIECQLHTTIIVSCGQTLSTQVFDMHILVSVLIVNEAI